MPINQIRCVGLNGAIFYHYIAISLEGKAPKINLGMLFGAISVSTRYSKYQSIKLGVGVNGGMFIIIWVNAVWSDICQYTI